MHKGKVYTVIGLMSGTSLDGVDAALLRTDGQGVVEPVGFACIPYAQELRDKIRACFGCTDRRDPAVLEVQKALTYVHAKAVDALLECCQLPMEAVDYIGFHGQTIAHDYRQKMTVQIGDAALLADLTSCRVVHDFRSADVAAGGQGAPLLPLYHHVRSIVDGLSCPVCVLNIGGVANVTWIGRGADDILAFDTGPGNALLDDFISRHTGQPYDSGGRVAASGVADDGVIAQWMEAPYFSLPAPKSLDRNDWNVEAVESLSVEDGAATLSAFSIEAVKAALRILPEVPETWYVTGGGRHNAAMMSGLQRALQAQVVPVEALGWDGDALEAEGFAYLAVRSVLGLPISHPRTTGVPIALSGGKIVAPTGSAVDMVDLA